mmetsp:Transcript_20444/g.48665  ORF Transcript_20444/g.48665 Transcript_20444/m.48665 type:complete len:405 (-) Transcript_20444:54-1268(-)
MSERRECVSGKGRRGRSGANLARSPIGGPDRLHGQSVRARSRRREGAAEQGAGREPQARHWPPFGAPAGRACHSDQSVSCARQSEDRSRRRLPRSARIPDISECREWLRCDGGGASGRLGWGATGMQSSGPGPLRSHGETISGGSAGCPLSGCRLAAAAPAAIGSPRGPRQHPRQKGLPLCWSRAQMAATHASKRAAARASLGPDLAIQPGAPESACVRLSSSTLPRPARVSPSVSAAPSVQLKPPFTTESCDCWRPSPSLRRMLTYGARKQYVSMFLMSARSRESSCHGRPQYLLPASSSSARVAVSGRPKKSYTTKKPDMARNRPCIGGASAPRAQGGRLQSAPASTTFSAKSRHSDHLGLPTRSTSSIDSDGSGSEVGFVGAEPCMCHAGSLRRKRSEYPS